MANDFQYVVKQHWAAWVQDNLEKSLVAMELADMVDIPNGTTKNLPRVAFQASTDYTKYTNVTFKDTTTFNDQLVINTTPIVPFNIDAIDVEDNYINITPEVIRNASYKLKERIDWDFFAEILNATWKYDNNGIGVNTWTLTPVALVTWASENITTVFGNSKAALTNTWANASNLALVVDDFTVVALQTLGLQAWYKVADESYLRGFQGMFAGMPVYSASNLTSTTTLDLATNPTAWDYVYIQGVKFTFASPLWTTAWNVLIWNDADASAQNLVAAVNGASGAGSTYVEVSADNRAKLSWITATDWTDLVTFVSKRWALLASSSMTNASNDFQAQAINCAIMEKGSVKMALRDSVKVESRQEPQSLVTNYMVYARYGLKTPQSWKDRMIRIVIQSKAAES